MRRSLFILVLLGFLLVAVLPATAQDAPIGAASFTTPLELSRVTRAIRNAEPAQAELMALNLYGELAGAGRIPLVLDGAVVFLYYGNAETVEWRGDFNGWQRSAESEGHRVGSTNLWSLTSNFPADARVEYKIVLNDEDWIFDPVNARLAVNGNLNSELRMPEYAVSDFTEYRQGIDHGQMGETRLVESQALGYPVAIEVYLPHDYDQLASLPVLYVLDGNDFTDPDMGRLPNALDNLIADGRIEPVIAVFIGARDPADPSFNRREQEFLENPLYAQFVARELVPLIDSAYATEPTRRHLFGLSYGGLGAAYIAVNYPDVFRDLTFLSPALWAQKTTVETFYALATPLNWNAFVYWGYPDWDQGDQTSMVDALTAAGVTATGLTTNEGHSWPTWRGVLDEVLEYFYGTT